MMGECGSDPSFLFTSTCLLEHRPSRLLPTGDTWNRDCRKNFRSENFDF